MALRPGCFNEPVRFGLQRRRRSLGLLVVVVIATWCIAMPTETMARPQQPVLPATDAQAHVQGAIQTSQSVVDSASAGAKTSDWRGVVHSWPGHSSYDQLERSVVYSSDPEATWLNQRTSRVEKTPNPPPVAHQPPPPTAPLGASLQAVATQLMAHVASPTPPPSSSPSPGSPPSRKPDPAVRMDPDDGFQGVAEPLEVHHDSPSSPRPPSSVLPSSLKPQHQRPVPLTTMQPQPSTTASERISTWILLSGPHGTSTTPSATTFTSIPPAGSTMSSSAPGKKTPALSTQSPPASPKPALQKAAPKRPGNPAPNQPTRKPVAFTKKPLTATTAAPSSTTPPAELVKIAETVMISPVHKNKLPASAAEHTGKKPGKPNNTTAGAKRPTTASTPPATTATPVTPVPVEKTKVSTSTVPFTPALAFRRRPADGKHRITTVAPLSSTMSSSTTLAPTTVEESTTLPSTLPDDAVTTTKRPKRPSSSHKKTKKKKKNRRRRPTKKTTTAVATTKPESKIGHDSNMSKPGQNGISTKIYNYLAREVMPSVSVGILGLVVTAGLAGLFLYPFGGGVAARRHDEHLGPHGRLPPDRNYYYERDYPAIANEGNANAGGKAEEEIIGQVFAGMQHQPETRYGYGPPIYGGGNGPPDAQYSESYDKTQLGPAASEPEEERPGEGEVKTYADPSPISSVAESLQKTRYDIASSVDHVPADQVDITYPPTKKEESPYVVGSIAADDASRYHYTGDANATLENAEENQKTAGSRYSVRVSGESGQVAVGYGAQSGAAGSVENADLGSSLELSYTGSGSAQPRRLKAHKRRRRQVAANLVDSKQNELDGPIPEDKKVFFMSTTPVITTEELTTVPVTEEVPTTTTVNSAGKEVIVEVVALQTSTPTSTSSSTSKTPSSTEFIPPAQTTDDPLASLVSLFKRLAEYKLRLGANFLRGTSDAVTRYLGGVARRMEAAVAHLSENRSRRRARRWEPFHIPSPTQKTDRAPAPSRAKHILKKATLTKQWQ